VAKSEHYRALRAASDAMQADAAAMKLREDYDAVVTSIQDALAAGRPVEPEDKRREADMRAQVTRTPCIVALLRAQADFHALMNAVNDAVQQRIEL
jgi:cell fate (sporulation/competence/biofilm development) regulator YlbF (YheA/YmcA/DUF963 family)